jgi:subtilisin family serine protease
MKWPIPVLIVVLVACAIGILLYSWNDAGRVPYADDGTSAVTNEPKETRVAPRMNESFPPQVRPVPRPRGSDKAVEKPADKDAIPGEFILSFFDDHDRSAFIELAKARGVRILDVMQFGHSVRIKVGDKQQLTDLLRDGPTPVEQGPNYFVRTPEVMGKNPMAPEYNYIGFGNAALQWLGMPRDGNGRGNGVTVAVLDTGVERHSSLQEDKVKRVNLMSESAQDPGGHGTAVASIIAAQGDHLDGMAPESRILSIQVLSADGQGDGFTLAKGIVEAVDGGARVINLSLASHSDCPILRQAVEYAVSKDVAVVAAVGNEATEGVLYPAAYPDVVAVSGVDASGRHLYFADRGPEVDIAAPGISVDAAFTNGTVAQLSGTSIAAPFVSGALADLLAANPGMSAKDAINILYSCADDAGDPGRDAEFGNGILDMGRVEERNTSGIYDVAVGDIRLGGTPAEPQAILYVQNRGTEALPTVNLNVNMGGVQSAVQFYNLAPGQTASRGLSLDKPGVNTSGSLTISCTAEIPGTQDHNPMNNSRTAVFQVVSAPAK